MNLRDALQGIYDSHGKLTPKLVVDVARDETHPLHGRFEWNDALAGEAWRRSQAHELIRSVKVVYKKADENSGEKSLRAFHAVRADDAEEYIYEPLEKVIQSSFYTELVRRDMERDWRTLKQRYDHFEEFRQMVREDINAA